MFLLKRSLGEYKVVFLRINLNGKGLKLDEALHSAVECILF